MTQTLLKIQGAGMPPVMLDQCTQTLEAMPLGGLHRTVNGELIYTGVPGRMKYRTVCSGTGNGTPGLDALKRGDQVTVHCIQRLWQEATGERTILSRPAVVGVFQGDPFASHRAFSRFLRVFRKASYTSEWE